MFIINMLFIDPIRQTLTLEEYLMLPSYRIVTTLLASLLLLPAGGAVAQSYPAKPIRIVTSGLGGSNDFAARMVAQGLAAAFEQQVIVDNRGGTTTSQQIVATAPPDGYTLLSYSSAVWVLPLLQKNLPYDPVRDFAPITILITSPNVLVTHPSLPVKSVKELIAFAKARPGQLNYSSTATGGPNHMAAELFKSMAGVNIVRIAYKGTSQSITDLMAGRVELAFPSAAAVSPHVATGRMRALAVSSAKTSVLLPEVPTMAAAGLPGYESVLIVGMFAPAATPPAIIQRLNQETVKVLQRPDVREKFLKVGAETLGNSPQEFAAVIKAEMGRMGKVIRESGIRIE